MVSPLVTSGTWAKLDVLRIHRFAADEASSLINMVSSNYPLVKHGSPVFEAGIGWHGTGAATDYLDQGFNPATAVSPKYGQNSASIGVGVGAATEQAVTAQFIGGHFSGSYIEWFSDGNLYWKAQNQTDQSFAAPSSLVGLWVSNRTAQLAAALYFDGSQVASSVEGSATVPNGSFRLLSNGANDPSSAVVYMEFIGGSLTADDLAALQAVSDAVFPNALNLVAWGDSMAAGNGVSDASQHWISLVAAALGRRFSNQGIPGATYPEVATAQAADTGHLDWTHIYWAGHNSTDATADLAAIDTMVGRQTGKKRFLIMLPTINANNPPNDPTILAERNAIIAAYPNNYRDTPTMLASHGNGTTDNADITNGYTPTSLRATSDTIHLNATGQGYVATDDVSALQSKGW